MEDDLKTRTSKRFFALCREAGFEAEESKEKVKKKYGLEHFTDITMDQLNEVIKSLLSYIDRKILGLDKATPIKPSVPQTPISPPKVQTITSQFGSF